MGSDDFGKALPLPDLCPDPVRHIDQHRAIGEQLAPTRHRAMSGHDPGRVVAHGERGIDRTQGSLNTAPAAQVDEREHTSEIDVAHVDHIGALEPYDGVAVGMGVGNMHQAHHLTPKRSVNVESNRRDGHAAGGDAGICCL